MGFWLRMWVSRSCRATAALAGALLYWVLVPRQPTLRFPCQACRAATGSDPPLRDRCISWQHAWRAGTGVPEGASIGTRQIIAVVARVSPKHPLEHLGRGVLQQTGIRFQTLGSHATSRSAPLYRVRCVDLWRAYRCRPLFGDSTTF